MVVLLKSILCATEEHFLCKKYKLRSKTPSLKNNKPIQVCLSFHQILKQFEGSKKHNIMAALHAKSRLGVHALLNTYNIFVTTSFAYNLMSQTHNICDFTNERLIAIKKKTTEKLL